MYIPGANPIHIGLRNLQLQHQRFNGARAFFEAKEKPFFVF
jgi:hypothetical protein